MTNEDNLYYNIFFKKSMASVQKTLADPLRFAQETKFYKIISLE